MSLTYGAGFWQNYLSNNDLSFDIQIDRTSLQSIAELSTEFDMHWARVKPGLCRDARADAPKERVFNSAFMRCLVKEGRKAGAVASPFELIE